MSTYRIQEEGWSVAHAGEESRIQFIHRTYQHLALALAVFVGLEALLLSLPGIEAVAFSMLGAWWLVLAVFMLVSWVAEKWAVSSIAPAAQYAGLFVYVVAEAVIFLPLLYLAKVYDADVIAKAGIATGVVFAGLTAFVLMSKRDFSFLRGVLSVVGFGALALIIISILFGMALGTWFSVVMVVFAGGAILYHTSNVLHRYRTDQHVAAALSLFASVALLLWYMVRLFMASRD